MSAFGRFRLSLRRSGEPLGDAGLAAERTAMAWQRTALGLGGVSALLLHVADRRPVTIAPGAAGLVVAVALIVLAEQRYVQTLEAARGSGRPMPRGVIRLLTGVVVVLSVSGIVLLVNVRT